MEKSGPYAGRKGAAFKGKIWERKKEQRVADLKRLLEGADAKAQAWKKVCRKKPFTRSQRFLPRLTSQFCLPSLLQANSDSKAKAKPALPF